MKRPIALTLTALTLALLAGSARAEDAPRERSAPWDPETVKLFQTLPVQERGRIKPLDTFAGFTLLKLRGVRSCPTPAGETLKPTEWLLDVLFFPRQAATYEVFLVEDSAVLDAIGLAHDAKRKRDRYSYADLEPGAVRLHEVAMQSAHLADNARTGTQDQILQLDQNIREYRALARFLDFARARLPLRATPQLQQVFGPQEEGLGTLLAHFAAIEGAFDKSDAPGKEAIKTLFDIAQETAEEPLKAAQQQEAGPPLNLFPSSNAEVKPWMPPTLVVLLRLRTEENVDRQIGFLSLLELLERQKRDPAQFRVTAGLLHEGVSKLATDRGEYSKVPLEVAFYKADFFYRSLVLFGLSFILVALSWLWPTTWLTKGSLALLALAGVLLVTGIVFRCIIRSRPPVSTLYETILFITAVAVITGAAIEWINRQGIAIAVAPLLGALGMFLANKYEFKESQTAGDTMGSLVAVLDTNFWLSTHVTSVTTGYSAGLLAAAIAQVWLLGRVFGWKKNDDKFYKTVARMTYGVVCFGLLFSTVGTILGGIWANYSWGRFWGWDPKENGALMIVIWELIILHARMGGYIRDYGLCVLTTLGGCVVAGSWWGVNLLGVGLHSYGFTNGIAQLLFGFWGLELLVVLLSAGWWLAQRQQAATPGAPPVNPTTGPVEA